MGTNIKNLAPYLIDGFTTNGLGVTPDPPATGLYNIFLGDDENLYLQDDADNITQLNGGGGSVPTATSGAGGGTQGKLTTDSDYGLVITAGVLTFSLSSTGGLEFVTGALKAKLDGATIVSSATGIKVGDDSITNTQINSAAGITRSKLASGTNNALVRNSSSGVMTDSANLTFSEGGSNHLLVVKANAAQSTNLHEWQNSGGTALSYVDSLGNILVPAAPTTGDMLVNKTYADGLVSPPGLIFVGSDVVSSGTKTKLQITGLDGSAYKYKMFFRAQNQSGGAQTLRACFNNELIQTGYTGIGQTGTVSSNNGAISSSIGTGSSVTGTFDLVQTGVTSGADYVWYMYVLSSDMILDRKCIVKVSTGLVNFTSFELYNMTMGVSSYLEIYRYS